jgi:hypothetical protein
LDSTRKAKGGTPKLQQEDDEYKDIKLPLPFGD